MKPIFLISILIFLPLFSVNTLAAAPTCQLHNGSPYCSYNGKVQRIYVNASNLILVYFDTPIDPTIPQSHGYDVTNGGAGAIAISENPEFAKLFYSTALAAQASGRNISIQMRNNVSSYLKIDRIWLSAP